MQVNKQTKENPKSNSRLWIVLLILAVILLCGGYIAYNQFSKNGTELSFTQKVKELTGSGSFLNISEKDLEGISDPLIRKHLIKQYSKMKFRTESQSSGRGQGSITKTSIDYRSQNDIRFQTTMIENGSETTNMIVIGDTTYIKDISDGKWWMQKQSAEKKDDQFSLSSIQNELTPEKIKANLVNSQVTYSQLGEEPCGNLTCYKYSEVREEQNTGTRTFWFDTKDLLLRKESYTYGEFGSTSTYFYDQVSVNAPSSTKAVPEGKSIYEMMISNQKDSNVQDQTESEPDNTNIPSAEEINQLMEQYGQDMENPSAKK